MFDAFKIGVRIAVSSNGSTVLGALMRDILGLHVATDKLTGKLNAVKIAAIGALGVFAGTEALRGMFDLVDHAKELNRELDRTNQLGGQFSATLGQARIAAFQTAAAVPTNTPAQFVRLQREMGQMLGDPTAAAAILPYAAKVGFVASNFTGESQEGLIKNLTKVADIRGQIFSKDASGKEVIDPAKAQSEMQAGARALILAAGFMTSGELVAMARQAGVPAKGMTQEAFYAKMVEAAVSAGAARTGTSVTSLFTQLVGGKMTAQTAAEMHRFGLLNSSDYRSDHGHIVTTQAASNRFIGALKDPIAYIEGPLNDAMNKKGLDAQGKLAEIFRLFGRQTTERFVAEALSNAPQFARARQIFGNIPGVDEQYKYLQDHDLNTNILSFTNAWNGLLQSLGTAGIPAMIVILQDLTHVLLAMTAWSEAHPELAKDLLVIGAALAAFTVVVGGLAVVITGITALAGALTLLVAPMAALAAAGVFAGLLATGEHHRTDKNYIGGDTPGDGHKSMGEIIWNIFKAHVANSNSIPVHVTNAPVVHVGNTGQMGHAISSGMAGGLRAAPNGPSAPTEQYRPRSPGMGG